MSTTRRLFGGLFLCLLILPSCEPSEEKVEEKISRAVEENKATRIAAFFKKCEVEAREKASHLADSILLARAMGVGQAFEDSPDRPFRPEIPAPGRFDDSLTTRPIFEIDSTPPLPSE
jgi:hypothetical protein